MPKINQEEYEILKNLDDKWKWIARDEDRCLYAFTEKPVRKDGPSPYWDTELEGPYTALELIDEIHLFQFIQWEDDDPYNIAELIEEYESEEKEVEKEVKKDLNWFKEQLDDIEMNTPSLWSHSSIWMLDRVNELLNQLDEPETIEQTTRLLESVLKENKRLGKLLEEKHEEWLELMDEINNQEVLSDKWINKNKREWTNIQGTKEYVAVNKLQGILVPKQEGITHKKVEKYLLDRNIRVIDIDIYEEMQSELEELKNGVTIPKTETVEVTEEQVMEWLDNNEFYCHATAETVLENAVDKGELGYYGTKYAVVKKPVIPKFVADWIEKYVEYGYDLYPALKKMENNARSWERIYDWYRNNTLEFVLAYLTQEYEIEEEQKYYVMSNDNRMMLVRMMDGKTITEADPFKLEDMYEVEKKSHRLTEQEIKDYDERYFAFAVKVEELEE